MSEGLTGTVRSIGESIAQVRRRRIAPIILELDLTAPIVERSPQDPVSAVMSRNATPLRDVVDGLRRAGDDRRVGALVIKFGGSPASLSLARAQELRDAIGRLRKRGKLTVAWAESFGELGGGTNSYYLATACERIWVQPSGDVCPTGVATQVPFLRDALDKAGIDAQFAQRHEYKNAANVFTERGFTEAHREAATRLVGSAMEQIATGVADGRGLDTDAVTELVDRAPLTATEASDAGLVDRLGYRDEVYDDVRSQVGDDAILQYVTRYRRAQVGSLSHRVGRARREQLAVIDVDGAIHLGKSRRNPISGTTTGSDTVTAALRAAVADEAVRAIVLRVASPGGSYVASDAIWRQVRLARDAGTPVVVSMGEVAASGGYFVSMGADVIVAEPGTVTGSIGVLGGKLVVDQLVERIGIGHDHVAAGDHALMFSPVAGFTDDEWARLNTMLDRIYADFIAKVADGRSLAPDHVEEVARGRVWTGADAEHKGLVDELGGFALAVEVAKDRAGIAASADPELRTYPRRQLLARLKPPESSEDAAAASTHLGWGSFAALAMGLGLPGAGPLTLPGNWRLTG